MKTRLCLLFLAMVGTAGCGDEEVSAPCGPESCPGGCCLDGECLEPSPGHCGTAGGECVDCLAGGRADECAGGACICGAAGSMCPDGLFCTASGCTEQCTPDCAGRCQGAPDGCGGTCETNECNGCCDAQKTCIGVGMQSDTACGSGGESCIDCTIGQATDSCSDGACVCAAAGSACPQGQSCTEGGCEGPCVPDCTGKCAGADDGCGGTCGGNDCNGCCNGTVCVSFGTQSDTLCGPGGSQCVDCTASGQICDHASHSCAQAVNDARFISQQVPSSMAPGQRVQVSLTFENTGTTTWTAAADYKLGAENPRDNRTWGTSRVTLQAGEQVRPGERKTFSFEVVAPAQPGTYDFQWRMLRELVEWFGEFSQNVSVDVGDISVCEQLRSLAGTDTDASGTIQQCIDSTPRGGILELPAGVYRIDHQIVVQSRAMVLRTEGKRSADPPCAPVNHDCAELRASTAFSDTVGILRVLASGSTVDHIVVNGNKLARHGTPSAAQCQAYQNIYGYNVQLGCDDCRFTNSVSRDALCGTCLEVSGTRARVVVSNSTVVGCGVHDREGLWSDGITVHDATDSRFTGNYLADNTDIDLIFGGCRNCDISGNTILHGHAFSSSSFAALMIHAWPTTSGNYQGTVVHDNTIDCGAQKQCGIGLYIGPDAWYDADTFGGSVHGNTVKNAQFGLLIDDAHDVEVYDNPVSGTKGLTKASCGWKTTYDYGIGRDSFNIDTSSDSIGAVYHQVDFDRCIPNWWNQ